MLVPFIARFYVQLTELTFQTAGWILHRLFCSLTDLVFDFWFVTAYLVLKLFGILDTSYELIYLGLLV